LKISILPEKCFLRHYNFLVQLGYHFQVGEISLKLNYQSIKHRRQDNLLAVEANGAKPGLVSFPFVTLYDPGPTFDGCCILFGPVLSTLDKN
jgi:hypothetical protein